MGFFSRFSCLQALVYPRFSMRFSSWEFQTYFGKRREGIPTGSPRDDTAWSDPKCWETGIFSQPGERCSHPGFFFGNSAWEFSRKLLRIPAPGLPSGVMINGKPLLEKQEVAELVWPGMPDPGNSLSRGDPFFPFLTFSPPSKPCLGKGILGNPWESLGLFGILWDCWGDPKAPRMRQGHFSLSQVDPSWNWALPGMGNPWNNPGQDPGFIPKIPNKPALERFGMEENP